MKFTITRAELQRGMQFITGVVERRQSMPILANVLLECTQYQLSLSGSNLEMELTAKVKPELVQETGVITVSGRKLMDICRVLPEDSHIDFKLEGEKALIQSGKSRFSLSTLPAANFPLTSIEEETGTTLKFSEKEWVRLLENTHFAMADQDVRYYLNGLFMEMTGQGIHAIGTDGHRLSLDFLAKEGIERGIQFILPRKAVSELLRILNKESENILEIHYASNAIRLTAADFMFVSRLIEGRYPDYKRVIPKNTAKSAFVDRDALKQMLTRAAVLTHEKHRAARFCFNPGILSVFATNTDHEEVQDEIEVDYTREPVEMAFNVVYLLDVMQVLPEKSQVKLSFSSGEEGILLESEALPGALYVVMPMSL